MNELQKLCGTIIISAFGNVILVILFVCFEKIYN